MPPSYWSCPGCGTRNPRVKQKCAGADCGRHRPKRRVPAHARTLRDDPYRTYFERNGEIHADAFDGDWDADCCGVCGKRPSSARHMDRDHDHITGLPRGLACPGNTGCNALMPRQMTLERARAIVGYLERVERFYALSGAYSTSQEVSGVGE